MHQIRCVRTPNTPSGGVRRVSKNFRGVNTPVEGVGNSLNLIMHRSTKHGIKGATKATQTRHPANPILLSI